MPNEYVQTLRRKMMKYDTWYTSDEGAPYFLHRWFYFRRSTHVTTSPSFALPASPSVHISLHALFSGLHFLEQAQPVFLPKKGALLRLQRARRLSVGSINLLLIAIKSDNDVL